MEIMLDKEQDDKWLITLKGRFDAHEVPGFRAQHQRIEPAKGNTVCLDLAEVVFMDSSALAELLRMNRSLQEQRGHLVLRAPSHPVRVILELTGLQNIFSVETSAAPAQAGNPRSSAE